MKKILIVHNYPDFGGSSKSLFEIIKGLKNSDFHIHVLTKQISNTTFKNKLNDLVDQITEIADIPQFSYYNGSLSIVNPNFWLGFLKTILKRNYFKNLIDNISYDVLICNSIVLSWFPLNDKKYNILFIRETKKNKGNYFFDLYQKNTAERFSLIVYLTLFDLYKFNINSNSIVIKDFSNISLNNLYENDFSSDQLKLLFLGGIDPIKGIFFLLNALTRYPIKKKFLLTIAGSINLTFKNPFDAIFKIKRIIRYSFFNFLLSKLPSNISVEFVGLKDNADPLYINSNITIFPMTVEHQSRPIFESGFYNRTIIVPKIENIKEIITDNEVFFYELNDAASLINLLNGITNDQIIVKSKNNHSNSIKNHTALNLNLLIERINEHA